MLLTVCCGGDTVSGRGDTYTIWAVFVYVCMVSVSCCDLQGMGRRHLPCMLYKEKGDDLISHPP